MNWLSQSLNRKFAAGTAAGLLASSLFFLVLFVNLYRGQLERERTDAATQVTRLLQASLEHVMLRRDVEGLREIVRRLGEEPGIQQVRITNPAGEVRFASDMRELGTTIAPAPDLGDRPGMQILDDGGGRTLVRSVNPIRNKPQCLECHGPVTDKPVNGVLYVDFDAASISHKARATTLLLMGSGALIVLINIAGGWWFIRRYVINPVEHLSDVSLRLAGGDLDARISLPGHDELSALAGRFNRMAETLKGKIRELREKETFMQGLVDAVPDGIRVIDEDFRVVLSNATYRQQLGYGEGARVPERCYAATHGRDSPCPETLTLCPLKEVAATGEPLRVLHRHQRADGETLDVEIYAAPLQVMDGEPRRMVVESIRDLERQVRFSHEQRLSELGRLAAGVAHEIHNPLAAVRMAIHAAKQAHESSSGDPSQVTENLELVDHELEKCSEVTERLLKLSMAPPSEPELVYVDQVLEDTIKLLCWESEHQGVEMNLEVEGTPLRVVASDSDLRMVTLNLTQNACHAMPRGGLLTVRCGREGDRVVIVFEDTGIGIDPRDLPRIFEPFFSRRADGVRGTGLGLPITKSLIEGHGGTLRVESEPGRGSRFTVAFPDADQAV
jgi:signal transduction histidine kinase/HAMP domain-containing protein